MKKATDAQMFHQLGKISVAHVPATAVIWCMQSSSSAVSLYQRVIDARFRSAQNTKKEQRTCMPLSLRLLQALLASLTGASSMLDRRKPASTGCETIRGVLCGREHRALALATCDFQRYGAKLS